MTLKGCKPKTEAILPELLCGKNDKDDDNEPILSDSITQALPSFLKKPEVIRMHLEILYKSINFLS